MIFILIMICFLVKYTTVLLRNYLNDKRPCNIRKLICYMFL